MLSGKLDAGLNSIIIPIPKKGNLRKCKIYRTISLISHASKVQRRRSTFEQILNLRILCEKFSEDNREIHHAVIDFKKAFDRVWRQEFWATMNEFRIDKDSIDCIEALYKQSKFLIIFLLFYLNIFLDCTRINDPQGTFQ